MSTRDDRLQDIVQRGLERAIKRARDPSKPSVPEGDMDMPFLLAEIERLRALAQEFLDGWAETSRTYLPEEDAIKAWHERRSKEIAG